MQIFRISRRKLLVGMSLASTAFASQPASYAQEFPEMTVTKDPSCGCCSAWIEHIRRAGFSVKVIESDEMTKFKTKLGVPMRLASCHTAEIGSYVVEGHVPAQTIRRLLSEKPLGRGLAVPGMPVGSPGMETIGVEPDTYDVVLFGEAGERRFARYKGSVLL